VTLCCCRWESVLYQGPAEMYRRCKEDNTVKFFVKRYLYVGHKTKWKICYMNAKTAPYIHIKVICMTHEDTEQTGYTGWRIRTH
jgi:hypothetical protein